MARPALRAALALCLLIGCNARDENPRIAEDSADGKALSLVETSQKLGNPFVSEVVHAFSALSSVTKTLRIENELLAQVPGSDIIGGAIESFLTWLVPEASAQLASPLLRELAANTMRDIMISVLTALLLLLEALALPVAAPVAPFMIVHSVMTLSSTTAAAMVGVQRVRHLMHAERLQHDMCSKVLTAWWARNEANDELHAVSSEVGHAEDEDELHDRVDALVQRVERLHAAAEAETEAVEASWEKWRKDPTVFARDDKGPLAKTYRLLESLSRFTAWFYKRLANKAMEQAWELAAGITGIQSLRPAEHLSTPDEESAGMMERAQRSIEEMAQGSALYDGARAALEDRMETALKAVRGARARDEQDPFPDVGDGSQPSTFFGDACIRIFPASTASTEAPLEECGTVAFAPDRFRQASDGFLFYVDTTGDGSVYGPRTEARHRRVAAHFKCLQLQGAALSALSEPLSDGRSSFDPVQVVAPHVMLARQLFNLGSDSGTRSCEEYTTANNVVFGAPQPHEMRGSMPGMWRRRLVLYADLEDALDNVTPSPGAPVRSITLLAHTYDRDGNCKKVAKVAEVRLRDGAPPGSDLRRLFEVMVSQIQLFAPSSWDDMDGAMLVGPSIPGDARRQVSLWTPGLHVRCVAAAEREIATELGISLPPSYDASGAGSDVEAGESGERGLGLCPPLFRQELQERVDRLRRLTERARAAADSLESSRMVANLRAMADRAMLADDDVMEGGIQMVPLNHGSHSRRADGSASASSSLDAQGV